MKETSSATAARYDAGCFVDYDARANLRKHWVVCGFSWLLRVIDHEAAPMDPKLFCLKLGSPAIGVVETWVWTADKQQAAGGASRKKMIG
jgi:hypothetical protein